MKTEKCENLFFTKLTKQALEQNIVLK